MTRKKSNKRQRDATTGKQNQQHDPNKRRKIDPVSKPSTPANTSQGATSNTATQIPRRPSPRADIAECQWHTADFEPNHSSDALSLRTSDLQVIQDILRSLRADLRHLEDTPGSLYSLRRTISSKFEALSHGVRDMEDGQLSHIKQSSYGVLIEVYDQLARYDLRASVARLRTALEDRPRPALGLQGQEIAAELDVRERSDESSAEIPRALVDRGTEDRGADYDNLVNESRRRMDESLWYDPRNDYDEDQLP